MWIRPSVVVTPFRRIVNRHALEAFAGSTFSLLEAHCSRIRNSLAQPRGPAAENGSTSSTTPSTTPDSCATTPALPRS